MSGIQNRCNQKFPIQQWVFMAVGFPKFRSYLGSISPRIWPLRCTVKVQNTPPKINSSPLKNDGWKMLEAYFRGLTVKFPGCKCQTSQQFPFLKLLSGQLATVPNCIPQKPFLFSQTFGTKHLRNCVASRRTLVPLRSNLLPLFCWCTS